MEKVFFLKKSLSNPSSLAQGLLGHSANGVCSSPGAKSSTDFFPSQNFEETHLLCGLATVHTHTNSAYEIQVRQTFFFFFKDFFHFAISSYSKALLHIYQFPKQPLIFASIQTYLDHSTCIGCNGPSTSSFLLLFSSFSPSFNLPSFQFTKSPKHFLFFPPSTFTRLLHTP